MEKAITRTIVEYSHVFGKVNKDGDNTTVDVKFQKTFPEKMGARKVKKFLEENNCGDLILLHIDEVRTKYSMSISEFIKYATKI